MDILPIELVCIIALDNSATFHLLAISYPRFGRETLSRDFREYFKTVEDSETRLCGQLHSFNDQPACMYGSDHKQWFQYGKLHRDGDKPAGDIYGVLTWYKHGLKHRDGDKPAIICTNGDKYWFKNGECYRSAKNIC